MTLPLRASVACVALVVVDLVARSWRLRALTAMAGHALSPLEALRVNLLADAGAILSPMRVGGEPARVAAMAAAEMKMPAIVATIGWELATAWPTLLGMGGLLVLVAAPSWLAAAWPVVLTRAAAAKWAMLGVVALTGIAVVAAARLRRHLGSALARRMAEYAAPWREVRRGTMLLSVALSAINVASRTALLPALAMSLDAPPPVAAVWLGSFLLVYGQLILPTPAGLGAVELGFLGGAAGEFGDGLGVLAAWRWWGTALPALLGILAAFQMRAELAGIVRSGLGLRSKAG